MKPWLVWLSIVCLSLAIACQSPPPKPQPQLEPIPFSSPISVLPPAGLDQGWQVWPIGAEPEPAYTAVISGTQLWVGTASGVIQVNLQTGLRHQYEKAEKIYYVLPMENGTALAAGSTGAFYFNGQGWRQLEFPELFSYYAKGIYGIGIDQKGDLWLQGSNSRSIQYAHFKGHTPPASGSWQPLGDQALPSSNPMSCDIWLAFAASRYTHVSKSHCLMMQAARAKIYDQLPERDRDLTMVVADTDRSIWWSYSKILVHVSPSQTLTQEVRGSRIYALAADPFHGVWVASDQGVAYSDGETIQLPLLDLDSRTFNGMPRGIAVDASGTVWINVLEDGTIRELSLNTDHWKHVKSSGLKMQDIRSIAAAPSGGFWATRGWDLLKADNPSTTQQITVTAPPCRLRHLSIDNQGHIWSPSRECGALEYNPQSDQWKQYQPDAFIEAVAVAPHGQIYLLGRTGLYASSAAVDWPMIMSLQDKSAERLLALGQQGDLWMASRETGELWHYANKEWTALRQQFLPERLLALYANDRLWAVDGNTLAHYADNVWKRIPAPMLGNISRLVGGPDGRIWLMGDRGIAVYDPKLDMQP